jgi:hypothetical protein
LRADIVQFLPHCHSIETNKEKAQIKMASILADSTHDATHGTSVEVEGAIMDAKIEDKAINQMRQTHCTKVVMGIFLFGFAVFVVVDAFTAQKVGKAIIVVLEWVEANPTLGVFVYVAFYFFATSE